MDNEPPLPRYDDEPETQNYGNNAQYDNESPQLFDNNPTINQQQPNNGADGLPLGVYEFAMPAKKDKSKTDKDSPLGRVQSALNNLRTQHRNERNKDFPDAAKLTRLANEISELLQRAEDIKNEKRRAKL